METKQKFSKKLLAKSIWADIEKLENKYGFKSYEGWSQVANEHTLTKIEYGKYECLLSLTNEYDLQP